MRRDTTRARSPGPRPCGEPFGRTHRPPAGEAEPGSWWWSRGGRVANSASVSPALIASACRPARAGWARLGAARWRPRRRRGRGTRGGASRSRPPRAHVVGLAAERDAGGQAEAGTDRLAATAGVNGDQVPGLRHGLLIGQVPLERFGGERAVAGQLGGDRRRRRRAVTTRPPPRWGGRPRGGPRPAGARSRCRAGSDRGPRR